MHSGRRPWSARRDDERGVVLVIVVLSIFALVTMSAIAVDLGRQMLRRREAQAVADVIAIDLVRMIDGRTEANILGDPDWSNTFSAAAARNNFPFGNLTAELGFYDPISDLFDPTESDEVPDSVRVTAVDDVEFFFGRVVGRNSGSVTRSAIASQRAVAGFTIGSFAARVDTSTTPIINELLNGALDTTLISYEGLATADVFLGDVAAQMGFGTPDELLTSSVEYRSFLLATADVLRLNGDTVNATLLETIVAQSTISGTFDVDDVFNVTSPGQQSVLDASTNVLDMLAAVAFLFNGSNALGVPTVNADIGVPPALTALDMDGSLLVVQPPTASGWGTVGTTAHNSQIDLAMDGSAASVRLLGGLVPTLANIDVDLELSIASSEGVIAAIGCGSPQGLDVDVLSGLVEIDMTITVNVLGAPVPLRIRSTPPAVSDTASFVIPPDAPGAMRETGSGSIGLTGLTVTGTGLLGALLTPVMDNVVTPLVAALDSQLLGPLSDLLGANVSGADVFLDGVDCEPPDLLK